MDGSQKSHTSPSHTREQVAKMPGVGTGTVARYDTVMNSNDEILKQEVLSGETSMNAGYKELTQSKKKKD